MDFSTTRRAALQVVLTTVVFAVLDFIWLGLFMNGFYKAELGTMARLSGANFAPVWWAAFAVYGVLLYATWQLFTTTPTGFIPQQDKALTGRGA